MKSYFLITFLAFTTSSFAQITLNSSDFQSTSGDEYISITNEFLDYSSTGSNYTWDFSSLSFQNQDTLVFKSLAQAPFLIQAIYGAFAPSEYQANYFMESVDFSLANLPTNLLPISVESLNEFIKVDADSITKIGFSADVEGTGIPFKSDTVLSLYKFPINFGDQYNSRGYTNIDLNPIYDLKLKQYLERNSEVDGYGTISTPYGSFDVLRLHHVNTELDSVYLDLTGTGGSWISLPLITRHEYEWWAQGENIPILKVSTIEEFGIETITYTAYKDNIATAGLIENSNKEINFYPNPSAGIISFTERVNSVKIYNSTGRCLYSSSNVEQINLNDFLTGVYFIEFSINDKSTRQKLIISK